MSGLWFVSARENLASGWLPSDASAHAAELNLHRFHTRSRLCTKRRTFPKSDDKLHHGKVAALFDAILHPKSMAACEHQAYANHSKRISAGNARARAAAKAAA